MTLDNVVQYGALGLLAFFVYHFLLIYKKQNEELMRAFRELSSEMRAMRDAIASLRVAVERLEAIVTHARNTKQCNNNNKSRT